MPRPCGRGWEPNAERDRQLAQAAEALKVQLQTLQSEVAKVGYL